MTGSSSFDQTVSALVVIRDAQRAIDTALRLPADDRAALADQIAAVREGVGEVASALATTVPGAQSLLDAGQSLGGNLATRPELRALGGLVGFFAGQGAHALGLVAGAAGSLGAERDRSLDLSERITARLAEVGVATRTDLARQLDVDPRSAEFRDALERTLGTGHAEWYGSGTYGLPRPQLEELISRARSAGAAEDAPAPPTGEAPSAAGTGSTIADLRSAVEGLRAAAAGRARAR